MLKIITNYKKLFIKVLRNDFEGFVGGNYVEKVDVSGKTHNYVENNNYNPELLTYLKGYEKLGNISKPVLESILNTKVNIGKIISNNKPNVTYNDTRGYVEKSFAFIQKKDPNVKLTSATAAARS